MSSGESATMLLEALQRWVREHPDKRLWTYLDDAGRETSDRVTYRQLDERTTALANVLSTGSKKQSPLLPGDRVLLVYPPSLHFMVAFMACLKAGLVAVPVYPPDPRKLRKDVQAFARTTASCGARVALTSSAYDHVKKASGIKARLTGDDSRWPESLQWMVTDNRLPASSTSAVSTSDSDEAASRTRGLNQDSLAFLQYTSGSTGFPKGVKITHGNIAHNLAAIIHDYKASVDTVVVSWLPQYHDMGLIGSVLGTLYCGGTGYYMSPVDFIRSPSSWLSAVGRYRATHLQTPNFAFAYCSRKWTALKSKPELDLSSVVHITNAAEPIDAASMDHFENVFCPYGLREGIIQPTYGLAEHTVFVCSRGRQRLLVDKRELEANKKVTLMEDESSATSSRIVGCGFPSQVEGVEVIIVEHTSRRQLSEDRVGEVWVRSPSKAHGYWGLLKKSKQTFCAIPGSVDTGIDDDPAGDDSIREPGDQMEEPEPQPEEHSACEAAAVDEGFDWASGFLRTGDEGFMHKGELFICGRIKDLVIIGGRNHYPQDLERTAERDRTSLLRPGCSAAFSVPGKESEAGEQLVIAVELRDEQTKMDGAQKRELAEEIRASVTAEHGVAVFHLLVLAPRANKKTTSGKIARQWCRCAYLDGEVRPLFELKGGGGSNGSEDAANSNTIAASLAGTTDSMDQGKDGGSKRGEADVGKDGDPISGRHEEVDAAMLSDEELLSRMQESLAQMCDGPRPEPDTRFYQLGLSSMVAAQYSSYLQQEYNARVPMSVLDADDTTLRSLAALVKAGGVQHEEGQGESSGGIAGTGPAGPRPAYTPAIGPNGVVTGVESGETIVRPGRCEETITNSCPCCLCLLSCPCCR